MQCNYKRAKKYNGKLVCIECQGGKRHVGYIRKVTPEGVWMEPQARPIAGEAEEARFLTADNAERIGADGENVWFGLFWIPFLISLALIPLAAGAAYGYGPGYGPGYGARGAVRRRPYGPYY